MPFIVATPLGPKLVLITCYNFCSSPPSPHIYITILDIDRLISEATAIFLGFGLLSWGVSVSEVENIIIKVMIAIWICGYHRVD